MSLGTKRGVCFFVIRNAGVFFQNRCFVGEVWIFGRNTLNTVAGQEIR